MRFGSWQPLEDAAVEAPEKPGVLQVRAAELVAYPRGRSAMIWYAPSRAGRSLRETVAGSARGDLRRAASVGGRWIRFAETGEPEETCRRLLDTFHERFGAPPVLNASAPTEASADEPISD